MDAIMMMMSGGLCTEAAALIGRMTTPPSDARKLLIDNTIRSLKREGYWDDLDLLCVMAAASAQAAWLNWKGPAFDLSVVGTPTFTADRGYTGLNTITDYLLSAYTPSLHASALALNSASLSVWNRTGGTANDPAVGVSDPALYLMPRRASDNSLYGGLNNTGSAPAIAGGYATAPTGLISVIRRASHMVEGYVAGALVGATGSTSNGLASSATRILYSSDYQLALVMAGAGRSAADELAITAILQTYMTAVGA